MASKFRYQLESLKKLRELKLVMAKADFAAVSADLSACDQKIVNAKNNVRELIGDQRQSDDISHVKLFSHLSETEHDRIELEMEKRKVLQADFDRHSAFVAFLRSELKAVERHEENQKELFHKEQEKTLSKSIDEIISIMWNRKDKGFV